MKQNFKTIIVILLVLVCIAGRLHYIRKTTPEASITIDEMTPLSLELVYQGNKPDGVSSVQSMAITDDYFIIAGRPFGSVAEGGETNNKLMVIDRENLTDVTPQFLDMSDTFELGHANGMTYNPRTQELAVVGLRNSYGDCDGVCVIDTRDFTEQWSGQLPCLGNGIAYDAQNETYYVRNGDNCCALDGSLNGISTEYDATTDLTNQDIGYYNGKLYLVNWAYHFEDALAVGLLTNQNVIYQYDPESGVMRGFAVLSPRMEMESIDFWNGEAYVLFNGGGTKHGYYYIYRVEFVKDDLE